MSGNAEKTRILEKIKYRKTFQSETWGRLDFILQSLVEAGFNRRWNSHIVYKRALGGQFFLMNRKNEKVTVIASDFLGKFVQVEFHKKF